MAAFGKSAHLVRRLKQHGGFRCLRQREFDLDAAGLELHHLSHRVRRARGAERELVQLDLVVQRHRHRRIHGDHGRGIGLRAAVVHERDLVLVNARRQRAAAGYLGRSAVGDDRVGQGAVADQLLAPDLGLEVDRVVDLGLVVEVGVELNDAADPVGAVHRGIAARCHLNVAAEVHRRRLRVGQDGTLRIRLAASVEAKKLFDIVGGIHRTGGVHQQGPVVRNRRRAAGRGGAEHAGQSEEAWVRRGRCIGNHTGVDRRGTAGPAVEGLHRKLNALGLAGGEVVVAGRDPRDAGGNGRGLLDPGAALVGALVDAGVGERLAADVGRVQDGVLGRVGRVADRHQVGDAARRQVGARRDRRHHGGGVGAAGPHPGRAGVGAAIDAAAPVGVGVVRDGGHQHGRLHGRALVQELRVGVVVQHADEIEGL